MRKPKTPVVQLSSAQLCDLAGPWRERLVAIATQEYGRLGGGSADVVLRTMQLMVNDYHATLSGRPAARKVSDREGLRAVKLLQEAMDRCDESWESAWQFARVKLFDETGHWVRPRLVGEDGMPVKNDVAPELQSQPAQQPEAAPQAQPAAEPQPEPVITQAAPEPVSHTAAAPQRASNRYVKQILQVLEHHNVKRERREELRRMARAHGLTEEQVKAKAAELMAA